MEKENGSFASTENKKMLPDKFASEDESGKAKIGNKSRIKKRETWSNKIDFLFACVGFSVGFGNVWRFPFLCYRNGGGAFLIPYLVSALLLGMPSVLLEVCLGQFMSRGGVKTWMICPLLKGVGLATTVILALVSCNYIIILTYAFYYLFGSFTSTLPWSTCQNEWNTENCTEFFKGNTSVDVNFVINGSIGKNLTSGVKHYTDSVTEYWENKVLGLSDDLANPGPVKWDLALCLLLSWVVVYLCICKGIKSSGKVMYFTVTSPYVLITILLIRGVTLEGAAKGIEFYLYPKWEKLLHPKVWIDAGTQVFYSYAVSMGIVTTLGSYNKFNYNCIKDVFLLCGINSCTSFFAGFVIFSTLGFMAHKQGMSVDDVAESGPGLVFIAYPAAISQMPVAPVWAVLFFFMVVLLGLDGQFVQVEGFVTTIADLFPQYIRKGYRREICIAICSCAFFLVGLSMITHGGMYVFQLFDFYTSGRITLLVACMECITVAWIYGVDRFLDNIKMMTGWRPGRAFKICWLFLTPAYTLIIFILGATNYSEVSYRRKFTVYHFSSWAIVIGWMLALSSVLCIPLLVIVQLIKAKGSLLQRIRYLTLPLLKKHQLRPDEDMSKVRLASYDDDDGSDDDTSANESCLREENQHQASDIKITKVFSAV